MKKEIQPKLNLIDVKCSTCSASFKVQTTVESFSVDVCSNCHPFYTGNVKQAKATGRVERFNKMMEKAKQDKK